MSSFDLADHVDEVTEMVREAGNLALGWFRRPLDIENKASRAGRFDPVTEADRAVEDALRARLLARFPDHEVFGEERGVSGATEHPTHRWVIDPIDGTRAFVTGQPLWGTLLGLQLGAQVLGGWLHQPVLGHTYIAAGDTVALVGGETSVPLAVSGQQKLSEAVLLCTHPDMFELDGERDAFERVASEVRMTRFGGDCLNYGYLATGYADLVIEAQLQPYDVIPLIPLVERAGGRITDRQGRPPLAGGWAVAAASTELHRAALELLNAGC